MSKLIISGGAPLNGSITVHGAKNSVLPILAATLVTRGVSVLHNCPQLSDVEYACRILSHLGCSVARTGNTILVDTTGFCRFEITEELMRGMRSSIVFLGPVLARMSRARLYQPGGCDLGPRPIDIHLAAFRQMGMRMEQQDGFMDCRVEGRLKGCRILLKFPSVGATENIMIAACLAEGTTVIENAAREPEIEDLAHYLIRCGAHIAGVGSNVVTVEGVPALYGTEHQIIPDRITAATYLAAAAATGGEISLFPVIPEHLSPVMDILQRAGCTIQSGPSRLWIKGPPVLKGGGEIHTEPYPGFPTDAQAPVMAALCKSRGTTLFEENIFQSRYKHVEGLNRMGADIVLSGRKAIVHGVPELYGEKVEAEDLRGGAALVVAALAALGESEITGLKHIDRGYEKIEEALYRIGAKIKRCDEWQEKTFQGQAARQAGQKMCI